MVLQSCFVMCFWHGAVTGWRSPASWHWHNESGKTWLDHSTIKSFQVHFHLNKSSNRLQSLSFEFPVSQRIRCSTPAFDALIEVYLTPSDLGWEPFVRTWLSGLPDQPFSEKAGKLPQGNLPDMKIFGKEGNLKKIWKGCKKKHIFRRHATSEIMHPDW